MIHLQMLWPMTTNHLVSLHAHGLIFTTNLRVIAQTG